MNLDALRESLLARDSTKDLAAVISIYQDAPGQNDRILALTKNIRKNMKNIQKQLKLK